MRTRCLITTCAPGHHCLLIDKTKTILRHPALLSCWLILIISPFLVARGQNNASPRLHLYVHYDYIVNPDGTSDAPDPEAIDLVCQAFAAHGIDLVIDSHHAAIPGWSMITFGSDGGDVPQLALDFGLSELIDDTFTELSVTGGGSPSVRQHAADFLHGFA